MAEDTTPGLEDGMHFDRNDLVALTAVVLIAVFALLFPYAVLSSEQQAFIVAPYPFDGLVGTRVYLLSSLTDDSWYHDYSALQSLAHAYGYIFILLTQAMATLHMAVGSGGIRSNKGLLLSLAVSAIWICLCQIIYGYPLRSPLSDYSSILVTPTAHLVQYPFVPLVSSVLMLLYRSERREKESYRPKCSSTG